MHNIKAYLPITSEINEICTETASKDKQINWFHFQWCDRKVRAREMKILWSNYDGPKCQRTRKPEKARLTYRWPQKEASDCNQSDTLRPSSLSLSRPLCDKRSITTYSNTSYSSCTQTKWIQTSDPVNLHYVVPHLFPRLGNQTTVQQFAISML
jgi:hypothetical protein